VLSTKTHTRTPVKPSDRSLIEELRSRVTTRKANQPPKPTVDQVAQVVEDVCKEVDLATTAALMGVTNQDAAEKLVLDIVATFGTWLAHSVGRADVEYVYAANDPQPTLFPIEGTREEGKVVIPYGYEPAGRHRRDVDKALCTIVHYKPDMTVISRFVARTYATRQDRFGYPIVAGVWKFASCGRLGSIDKVSDDLGFQEHVLEAFDLLDVAREDAIAAVRTLLSGDVKTPEELLVLCDKAYWLDEQGFASLRRSAEAARKSQAATDRMQRDAGTLARKVTLQPSRYLPAQVSDLTLGQVRRICTNAGIRVEPESRAEEAEIRMTLKNMGFSVDADRLVPEALRCAEKGTLDNFWAVMQARAEGDPTWSDQLEELSAN
jgi:hypothetical protein